MSKYRSDIYMVKGVAHMDCPMCNESAPLKEGKIKAHITSKYGPKLVCTGPME